ncbi:Globin, partial [Operophtera brumata]
MLNSITNLWWGGDPDLPDHVSDMTLRDINNVQRTWAPVYAQCGTYGLQMFLRLFRKDPITKTFFKTIRTLDEDQISNSYQFKAHVKTLMASINTCVDNLKEPRVVVALMTKLGESHNGRHIQILHFEVFTLEFKEIWVDVFENELQLNEQEMASWIKFISFIYKHIFERLNG